MLVYKNNISAKAMKPIIQLFTQAEPIQLKNSSGNVFITLFQRERYIEAKWQGYITAEDVVAAATVYLSFIKEAPCSKLLNDKTDVSGDWIEANSWLEFEWLPQALEAGLRCITHVFSSDMFSQLSARDLYLRVSPILHIETFSDRDQAINWLLSCDDKLVAPES